MRKLWTLLLFLLVLLSLGVIVPRSSEAQPAKWTFMVYMGADSSLESFGIEDFNEMAEVGSENEVNIVVQFDRTPSYDTSEGNWDTTKRYLVGKDMRPNPSSALSDIGEVNMGDPQTLVDFVNWAMENYTAERYFLNLWGHGRGWRGVVQDLSSGSDYLELDELKWAFETILASNGGKKIDLLGADACRMSTEMNYQLKDYVRFFVGSQKDEPEPGWPYDSVLHNLTSDPDMGPAELGRTIADAYVESYEDNTGLAVALSVIDASRLEYLGEEVRRFVDQARSALPMYVDMFKSARLGTEKYEGDSVYDMYDLFYRIEQSFAFASPVPRRLMSQLSSSQEAVTSTVSYERHWDNPGASVRTTYAHGMSVWYPLGIVYSSYHDLDFSNATGWDDYLLDFKAAVNGEVSNPEVSLQIDMTFFDTNSNGQDDTVQLELTSPQNATLEIDVYHYFYPAETSPISPFLPAGVPRFENVTLSEETFTDFDFYL
ncbi:MAG: clostripain-related cysteine peptidase, partial [Thermoplasmata archaeon]